MRSLTRERLLAMFVVVIVSLVGAACGGGGAGGNGSDGQDTSEENPGTAEDTDEGGREQDPRDEGGGRGGPGAVVSPLRIPVIQQKGASIGAVRDSIKAKFVEACGGELCVDLSEANARGGAVTDKCTFSRTDPPEDTEVKRGSTVTLILRCEDGGSGGEEEDNTTTTEEPGDSGS
jgi:hypothetical protein